jgi:hypothetical protein
MENPWLHRYAVLVAVCTALLFITGTAVTSNEERPLYSLGQGHMWLGVAVTILMVVLVTWLSRLKERAWLRQMVWAGLGANIVEDLLGLATAPQPAPVRISHALLGQLFFSTTVAIAVSTSKRWNQSPKLVENGPRLRVLATTMLALMVLQVTLGTAFRHGVMGVLPHILGALGVAVFLGPAMAVILGIEHPALRPAGIALTVLASLQVLLGFALLTMESFDIDPVVMIIATTAHATLGASTLAAAVVMAMLVRRLIQVR